MRLKQLETKDWRSRAIKALVALPFTLLVFPYLMVHAARECYRDNQWLWKLMW